MTSQEQLFAGFGPGHGLEWLENVFIPQSTIFYTELLPIVYQCTIAVGQSPVRICDIGSASGAGPNLIWTVQNHLLGWPTEMTCYDIDGVFYKYARAKYPGITYNVGDFFADDAHFDLGIVSHVLEHVREPVTFVERLLDRVQIIVAYVPYLERNLIPGHINRFDAELINGMPGVIWTRIMRSIGWRTERNSLVAAFVCVAPGAEHHINLGKLTRRLGEEFEATSFQLVDEQEKSIGVLKLALQDRDQELASVYASRSWRLTSPLRMICGLLRRLKGRN